MKNGLFFNIQIIVCHLLFAFLSAKSFSIPPEYSNPDNIALIGCLKNTVRNELHIVEYTKNIGYYSSDESVGKVLSSDEKITEASIKYGVPKEMIQAILFKEIRMIDFRDSISDFIVDECFTINRHLRANPQKTFLTQLCIAMTNTKGSSTGIGQIFPETAIKAYNWYCSKNGDSGCEGIDCECTGQREKIWRSLQDEKTNIDFVALILKYEATENLGIDIRNANDKEIISLFVRYNGAGYYGDEVFKYYTLFKEIKPA